MKKVILVDGTGLIYRGFYSIPPYLKSPTGVLTNAVYGFTMILLSIIETQKPDCIAVAFDRRGKTFRHVEYADYKATRTKAPQDLYDQIPLVKKVVEACGVGQFEAEGFEADDIIATFVEQLCAQKEPCKVMIATGDFDVFQLARKNVSILYPTKGFRGADVFTPESIKEKYGIFPLQIPDYKGLAGDSSDNIPGVRGIGDKTAVALLNEYGTLEKIYENIEKITGAKRTKLEAGKESAFNSRHLAELRSDVPVAIDINNCHVAKAKTHEIETLFKELGFNSLLRRCAEVFGSEGGVGVCGNTDDDELEKSNDFDALFASPGETHATQNTAGEKTKTVQKEDQKSDQVSLF